jgi:pilus assembly protein CpaC
METNRLTATIAALLIAALSASTSHKASAQPGKAKLTKEESKVIHRISKSVEQLELIVKGSRILELEERFPRFLVHNQAVLGATPISQNQIQVFAKTPGTAQLKLWDTNDKLYTVNVTVLTDTRVVDDILRSQLPFASLMVMPLSNSAIVSGTVTSVDDVDRAIAIVEQFYPTVVNNIKVVGAQKAVGVQKAVGAQKAVGVQKVLPHAKIMEKSRKKRRDLGSDRGSLNDMLDYMIKWKLPVTIGEVGGED